MCLDVGGMIRILGRKCWLIEITFRKGSHFKKERVIWCMEKTRPSQICIKSAVLKRKKSQGF